MILTFAQQQIVDGVAANGVSTASYEPRTAADAIEFFSYTIGLPQTLGWPEFLVAGLDPDRSVAMLGAAIAAAHAAGGPRDGLVLAGVVGDRPVRLRRRSDLKARHRAMADWYAGHAGYTPPPVMFQLVWPDSDGFFPDHDDCHFDVASAQALDGA